MIRCRLFGHNHWKTTYRGKSEILGRNIVTKEYAQLCTRCGKP